MRHIEVDYLINNSIDTDHFVAEKSTTNMIGIDGQPATVIRLREGMDDKGRKVRHAIYRTAVRVITYED